MKKKKKTEQEKAKRVFIALIGFVILIAVGSFIFGKLEQRNLENKFALIARDIHVFAQKLKAMDQSIKTTEERYCDNYSEPILKGPLHCDVQLILAGPLDNSQTEAINDLIANQSEWEELKKPNTQDFPYGSGKYTNRSTGLTCTSSYSSYDLAKNDEKMYKYYILCSELSDRAFYPYRTN